MAIYDYDHSRALKRLIDERGQIAKAYFALLDSNLPESLSFVARKACIRSELQTEDFIRVELLSLGGMGAAW